MDIKEFSVLVQEEYAIRNSLDNINEDEFVSLALQLLDEIRFSGRYVDDFEQREWLANTARRWGKLLYDKTGDFYSVALLPHRSPNRVCELLFFGKKDDPEWQDAGKIPIYYFKTGDKVIINDIRWLINKIQKEEDNHYVFVIFQDNLTDKAFQMLAEFNRYNNLIIIPVRFSIITQVLQEPGLASQKLVQLKRLASRFWNIPVTRTKSQKILVKTDDELANMARP